MEKYRSQLNEIDDKMLALFTKRLDIITNIAKYKQINKIDVLDENREQAIINKGLAKIDDYNYKQYYKRFIKLQLAISKDLQNKIIHK